MCYTINKLAKLAGVSTRTLRYYDEIGLLKPNRINSSGYRLYEQGEVDRLQQILLYRELGMPLEDIGKIIESPEFDRDKALADHLKLLISERERIDTLITNVTRTISASKGEITMSNKEKFEGLINENEKEYGKEIRAKYGDDKINKSNAKIKGMTEEQYAEVEKLSLEVNELLKAAVTDGNPSSEIAVKLCEAHKKWLCYYWDSYSKEAHIGLAQMYVDDSRFTAYYDNIIEGGAVFLRDALVIYLS
jgi:Predicted transcriptional regulators